MSKINIEAKKERHKKLFEGQYQSFIGYIWFLAARAVKKIVEFFTPSQKILPDFVHPIEGIPTQKKLYIKLASFSFAFLVINSVNISNASNDGVYALTSEELSLNTENLISDDEGFFIKSLPFEGESLYNQNRTEEEEYEVKPGDTLSIIAYRYGIKTSTIKYANPTIGSGNYLKVGQKLSIPPKDGYYATVKSGDTLAKLTERHKGNIESTKEFNQLTDDSELASGDEILIVDGRPEVTYVAATASSTYSSYSGPTVSYYDIPPNDLGWIRPTSGIITNGFKPGHYAYDVADSSRPPILAAAAGTVVKASSGTWGGGYGTHLIIDHGNGYQTLYAHAEVLYVGVGDYVEQGQVIAKMGNTGRVYGRTGIHLHIEVYYNGTKVSPSIMGVW